MLIQFGFRYNEGLKWREIDVEALKWLLKHGARAEGISQWPGFIYKALINGLLLSILRAGASLNCQLSSEHMTPLTM